MESLRPGLQLPGVRVQLRYLLPVAYIPYLSFLACDVCAGPGGLALAMLGECEAGAEAALTFLPAPPVHPHFALGARGEHGYLQVVTGSPEQSSRLLGTSHTTSSSGYSRCGENQAPVA